MGSTRTGKSGKKLLVAIFWLVIWGMSSRLAGLPFLLPDPLSTLKKMIELWGYSSFWLSLSGSLFRVMIGFFLYIFITETKIFSIVFVTIYK